MHNLNDRQTWEHPAGHTCIATNKGTGMVGRVGPTYAGRDAVGDYFAHLQGRPVEPHTFYPTRRAAEEALSRATA